MQAVDEVIPGELPYKKIKTECNELEQLKNHSLVVADTGDFTLLEKYQPEDSTTNPTLILQAAKIPECATIIDDSIKFALENYNLYNGPVQRTKKKVDPQPVEWKALSADEKTALVQLAYDRVFVAFGQKILSKIKGYVSTQVDARLSFDKAETVKRAKRIIEIYKSLGVDPERILIKIATTWEGIKAAETLLKSKIKCNMTLVFHKAQAVACANSKLFLISPFVGRILDWHKKETGLAYDHPSEDPGVISVTEIYNYLKKFDKKTIIMGASFRSTAEIKELCGCDRLTISPKLLEELSEGRGEVPLKLEEKKAKETDQQEIKMSEELFRYEMNRSKMATDLLSAGIRKFEDDSVELQQMILKRCQELYQA